MVTSVYTAEVKLNKTDKEFKKMLILHNPEDGFLMIQKGLFSISFESQESLDNSDVEIKDKRLIGDINL